MELIGSGVYNDDEIFKHCVSAAENMGPIRNAQRTVADAALRLLEGMCARDGDPLRLKEQPPRVINCRNGELWLTDDNQFELRPLIVPRARPYHPPRGATWSGHLVKLGLIRLAGRAHA